MKIGQKVEYLTLDKTDTDKSGIPPQKSGLFLLHKESLKPRNVSKNELFCLQVESGKMNPVLVGPLKCLCSLCQWPVPSTSITIILVWPDSLLHSSSSSGSGTCEADCLPSHYHKLSVAENVNYFVALKLMN